MLHHALLVQRCQPVPDQAALAETLDSLGFSFSARSHADQAEPLIAEALLHAKAAWGEKSSKYVHFLNDMATVKVAEWDYAGAESIFRRVVALQDQLAPSGADSIPPLINLCICLFNEEKLADARQMVDRSERDARRLYGEKSIYVSIAIAFHAIVDAAAGDYQTAIPLLREALPLLGAVYHPGQTPKPSPCC